MLRMSVWGKLTRARECEEFTTCAFDEYEPALAAAHCHAAMGGGNRVDQQLRLFTNDQLALVCLQLKLGKRRSVMGSTPISGVAVLIG
jgi:hypothetical protein